MTGPVQSVLVRSVVGKGSVVCEVIWIEVKPAYVVNQTEINGYTLRQGNAVVPTGRHRLVFLVANAI